VMRYVITGRAVGGQTGEDYPLQLRGLIKFFVMARALRNEPLFGVTDATKLTAAATVSFPALSGTGRSIDEPAEMTSMRKKVWNDLGAGARKRYNACTDAWQPLTVTVPHTHLNMIGVLPTHQGRGLARRLLDHVRHISIITPGSEGVTLTTEDPANVAFYEKFGYEIVGHARVTEDFETWGMFKGN